MNEKYYDPEHQARIADMCYPYAKGGLGALISSLRKDYVMVEKRFDNDD